MLDFILRNQDNIILGLIFVFIGAAIGPLVGSFFTRNSKSDKTGGKSMTQIIKIDNSRHTYIDANTQNKTNTDDVLPVVYAVIVAACLAYVYWRYEVLVTLSSISFFTLGLFISATFYSYFKGVIDGTGWTLYLLLSICAGGFSFILVASALEPVYAPDNINNLQNIFRDSGFSGLLKTIGIKNLTWLITHVAGVFIVLYMQIRLSLSLAHYLALIRLSTGEASSGFSLKLVEITSNYKNPVWNGFLIIFLSLLSYLLVNGYINLWYTQFMLNR